MNHFAGTATLVRLILRRDRVRLPVWILAIVAVTYLSAAAVADAYSTPAQIQAYAATMGESPTAIAMGGPPVALTTMGGILVYETAVTVLVAIALMSIFLTVRHTRADEEDGRTELLRSAVVGRDAHVAATFLVLTAACVLVGVGVASALLGADVPAAGAVVYGVAVAAFGVVFAAVASLAAQLSGHARGAVGMSVAVLGAAFLLRAVGDVRGSRLSWVSPMGWSQQVRAFDGDRWWPLALSALLALVLLVAVDRVAARRDLGAGVLVARPGPAHASRWLSGPTGLAWRLQRGSVLGWSAGVLVGGAVFGSMSEELRSMVESNPALAEYFSAAGDPTLVDSFFAVALLILSLLGSAFAVGSALRTRGEESAGRAESLLTTGLSRSRWFLGSLLVTLAGTTVVVLSAGLGIGLAHAVVSDDPGQVPRLVALAAAYLPAAVLLGALAVALVGWAPRQALVSWAVVALAFVVGWLGELIRPPGWVVGLSPFSHMPQVPAEPFAAGPLVGLTLVAGALVALGLVGLRRRDLC